MLRLYTDFNGYIYGRRWAVYQPVTLEQAAEGIYPPTVYLEKGQKVELYDDEGNTCQARVIGWNMRIVWIEEDRSTFRPS